MVIINVKKTRAIDLDAKVPIPVSSFLKKARSMIIL